MTTDEQIDQYGRQRRWPLVDSSDWCGDHEPKPKLPELVWQGVKGILVAASEIGEYTIWPRRGRFQVSFINDEIGDAATMDHAKDICERHRLKVQ